MAGLSRSSHVLVEEFFREYLGEPEFVLPRTVFATGRTARVAARLLKIHGITIGRLVFIAPDLLERFDGRSRLPRDLVVHEIAHVIQYRRYGFFRFLYIYFRDYLINLRKEGSLRLKSRRAAYLAIPFEREARQTAHDFVHWMARMKS